jgi:hypothetical protein
MTLVLIRHAMPDPAVPAHRWQVADRFDAAGHVTRRTP